MADDRLNKNAERSRDILYSPRDTQPPVYINNIGGAYSVTIGSENAYRIFIHYRDAERYAKSISPNVIRIFKDRKDA